MKTASRRSGRAIITCSVGASRMDFGDQTCSVTMNWDTSQRNHTQPATSSNILSKG